MLGMDREGFDDGGLSDWKEAKREADMKSRQRKPADPGYGISWFQLIFAALGDNRCERRHESNKLLLGGADKDRDEDKHLIIRIIFLKDILITVSRHKHFMWEFS